jgi:hypothetical protein
MKFPKTKSALVALAIIGLATLFLIVVVSKSTALWQNYQACGTVKEITDQIRSDQLADTSETSIIPINFTEIDKKLQNHDQEIKLCLESLTNNRLVNLLLPAEITELAPAFASYYPDLKIIVNNLATKDQLWLILFQNSDELRATGGFTGSYALAQIKSGKVSELVFEDIYDADGQFQGFVEPPPGVKEYLSSNNGLRLPDANWHPDVARSIQQQLNFFALGSKQNIQGVIVVNLPFVEKLLDITGPIKIADYDAEVSSQNINQVMRDERDDFFAGSIQKKHILSLAAKQVLFKLKDLEPTQHLKMIPLIQNGVKNKELMFYSRDTQLQDIFRKFQTTGEINTQKDGYFIGLVESNVGINKANRGVHRTVNIDLQESRSQITINFNNDNPNQGYVNYQRFLVAPDWNVHNISINGQNFDKWDEEIISTSLDQNLKQIGFVLTVTPGAKTSTQIELIHPPLVIPTSLLIYKQPGLEPTPYTVNYNGNQNQLLLESDQSLMLE